MKNNTVGNNATCTGSLPLSGSGNHAGHTNTCG